MKTLFIPAKVKYKIDKSKFLPIIKGLPKNIAIAYSIQYQNIALEIKKAVSKKHRITKFVQVLGCSKLKLPKNTQAVLLIGSGKFHGISLTLESKLPIYIYQENNTLYKISNKDIDILKKKQKASYVKFLNAKKVGILVSTKPGQENLKKAIKLKKKLSKKDKDAYLFISNNIDTGEFENFGLESWVNTACPRLDMNLERGIVNVCDVD